MPLAGEGGAGGAGRSGANRFDQGSKALRDRRGPSGPPGGGGAARPAPTIGNRFEGHDLEKLTPFAMPKPEIPESVASLFTPNSSGSGTWAGAGGNPAIGGSGSWTTLAKVEADREQKQAEDAAAEAERPNKPKTRRTYRLTWDEYQKLSDDQRAAVDFNTALVRAREKDLNAHYDATPQQKATYDKALENMFGPDGGSDIFAPETLALLRKSGIKGDGTAGADMDDFLGLKNAISAKELEGFSFDPKEVAVDVVPAVSAISGLEDTTRSERSMEQIAAQGLAETLAKGNQMLQSFQATAKQAVNSDLGYFGGIENKVRQMPGFGEPTNAMGEKTLDGFFQDTYDRFALARGEADLAEGWKIVDSVLKPAEKEQLFAYLDARSRQDGDLGSKGFRSPEEFRELFGFDRGGKR